MSVKYLEIGEADFWGLIEKLNWKSDLDTERCKKYIEANYSEKQIKELAEIHTGLIDQFYNELMEFYGYSDSEYIPFCGRCFIKTVSYLIGLGENYYYRYYMFINEFEKEFIDIKNQCVSNGLNKDYYFWEAFNINIDRHI